MLPRCSDAARLLADRILSKSTWPIHTQQPVLETLERTGGFVNSERQPRKIRIKRANRDPGMRRCPTLMKLQEVPAIMRKQNATISRSKRKHLRIGY